MSGGYFFPDTVYDILMYDVARVEFACVVLRMVIITDTYIVTDGRSMQSDVWSAIGHIRREKRQHSSPVCIRRLIFHILFIAYCFDAALFHYCCMI